MVLVASQLVLNHDTGACAGKAALCCTESCWGQRGVGPCLLPSASLSGSSPKKRGQGQRLKGAFPCASSLCLSLEEEPLQMLCLPPRNRHGIPSAPSQTCRPGSVGETCARGHTEGGPYPKAGHTKVPMAKAKEQRASTKTTGQAACAATARKEKRNEGWEGESWEAQSDW